MKPEEQEVDRKSGDTENELRMVACGSARADKSALGLYEKLGARVARGRPGDSTGAGGQPEGLGSFGA